MFDIRRSRQYPVEASLTPPPIHAGIGRDVGKKVTVDMYRSHPYTLPPVLPAMESKWFDGFVSPSGVIYCTPYTANCFLRIDPSDDSLSLAALGGVPYGYWTGAAITDDGKIYSFPSTGEPSGYGEILVFDTKTQRTSVIGFDFPSSISFGAAVVGANGKIYGLPYNSNHIVVVDPSDNTVYTINGPTTNDGVCYSGCLHSDGNIYAASWNQPRYGWYIRPDETIGVLSGKSPAPFGYGFSGTISVNSRQIIGIPGYCQEVMEIDPVAKTGTTLCDSPNQNISLNAYRNGVLAGNGKIYGVPLRATNVIEIDPVARSARAFGTVPFSEGVTTSSSGMFQGAVLADNGKIYGIPWGSSYVLVISGVSDPQDTPSLSMIPLPEEWGE